MLRSIGITAIIIILISTAAWPAERGPLEFHLPGGTLRILPESPLFEIYTTLDSRDKQTRRLLDKDFRHFEEKKDGSKRVLTFSNPPDEWGGDIRVVVTMDDTGKEVLTRLSIESESYFPVRLIRFPVLDTPPVNRYDTYLMSTHTGDMIHDPRVMIGTRLGGYHSRIYPAEIAMQYMVFYNEARSHYLSAYSDGDETFSHTVRTAGKSLRMSCDWYPFLDDGGKWESPQCSISVLPGGWHPAADLYREHMGSKFRPPDFPKWMKESFHGWVQISMKGGENPAAYKYTDLPDVYRTLVEPTGLNVLHIFSWNKGGINHHFPDAYPSPYCGTAEELAEAMDKIRAMGGYADLYTHGRSVDIDSDFYRNGGDKSLVMHEDGGPNIDGWGTTPMRQACPFSTIFQDEMVKWFKVIVEDYRAHGAQIDTNSCTPAHFCFDKSHGHRTPAANWLPGSDALFSRIRDTYRSRNPDFFVWVEGVHERYGQFYEVNQSHGEGQEWSAGESLPEQFIYTYPDFIYTGLCDDIDDLCHSYGQGKLFDLHSQRLKDPNFTRLLKEFVAVRKQRPEYFLRGRFMDTVGLTVAGSGVKYWRIDRRDGKGSLVNFWARGRELSQECEAAIRLPQGITSVSAVYPSSLKISRTGEWRTLNWTGPVATIVLEPGMG